MIKVLEQAIEKIKALPRERQEYAAEVLESIVAEQELVPELSEEDRLRLEKSIAQADRGEFASAVEVERIFAKYRV